MWRAARQQVGQAQSYSAGQASRVGSAAAGSGATAGVVAESSNAAACATVDQAIDNLNARMRQRYGTAEGERLRAQWHDLKQQRYDLKCGR